MKRKYSFLIFFTIANILTACRFHDTDRQEFVNQPQLSIGEDHSCYLASSNQMYCWGLGDHGRLADGNDTTGEQRNPPGDTSILRYVYYYAQKSDMNGFTFESISSGAEHTCGLTNGENVSCWGGEESFQQSNQASGTFADDSTENKPTSKVLQFLDSDANITELTSSNTTENPQQNEDNRILFNESTEVMFGVKQLSGRYYTTCAVIFDGSLKCWGTASYLDGTEVVPVIPRAFFPDSGASIINSSEQCISGSFSNYTDNQEFVFAALTAAEGFTVDSDGGFEFNDLQNVEQVAVGFGHGCALIDDGSVKCWGAYCDATSDDSGSSSSNDNIEIVSSGSCIDMTGISLSNHCSTFTGSEEQNLRSFALDIPGVSNAIQVDAGEGHACALISDGTIQCWGQNDQGQIGNGTTTDATTVQQVSGISTAKQIALGDEFSCAVLNDGTVRCWGNGNMGRLGITDLSTSNGFDRLDLLFSTTAIKTTPVTVDDLSNVNHIATGLRHTCALTNDLFIKCWGESDFFKLGNHESFELFDTTGTQYYIPAYTPDFVDPCAQNEDGSLDCFANVNFNF